MCPPIKVEIVFITVTEDQVAVMTRRIHQLDPTPANTKVNWVLPARQPAAVTHICYRKSEVKNFSTVIKVKLLVSKASNSCFKGFDFFEMLLASHN